MKSKKKLILHADDLGISPAVNNACFLALKERWITSASAMVPGHYFSEVVKFSKRSKHKFDLGIHLTFTSEWKMGKLSPITNPKLVSSLVNRHGHFRSTTEKLLQFARVNEIEIEARAQIEHALKMGFRPTHLDCHMFALYKTPALRALLRALSFQYNLPILFPDGAIFAIPEGTLPANWVKSYIKMIVELPEGLSEIIVHPGFDTPHLRKLMGQSSAWGSAWRARDLEFIGSYFLPGLLKKQSIELVNWKMLQGEKFSF